MTNILTTSFFILFATIFFVINDAIINYLSLRDIQFYHFVFYGTPVYLLVPFYLFLKGQFRLKLKTTNYLIPLIRGLIFMPMPLITFVSLKNIKLPEFTTLSMSTPIFSIIFSIFFLKDKLNFLLFVSLVVGIAGVLLVVQPGFNNFNIFFILVLFGSFLMSLTTFIVNKYNKVTSSVGYFVYGGVFVHILSFTLFMVNPLFVDLLTFLLITVSSIFVNFAIFFMVYAFQNSQKYSWESKLSI